MAAPKLLDLFCCEGGAGTGYARAGFEVVGVDLNPKFAKRYPYEFHAADAIQYVRDHGHKFDVIHASPPCQLYSITNASRGHNYPDLIGPTREVLQESGKPWVIENVKGAPLHNPLVLRWPMFFEPGSVFDDDGTPLTMLRERWFESNVILTAPPELAVPDGAQIAGSYGGARRDKWEAKHIRKGGYVPSKEAQQRLLGVDWMTIHGMYQSIPPVYSEWVGKQLLVALNVKWC